MQNADGFWLRWLGMLTLFGGMLFGVIWYLWTSISDHGDCTHASYNAKEAAGVRDFKRAESERAKAEQFCEFSKLNALDAELWSKGYRP